MPSLIFLTGAPASGKSTLARRLVAERPLALLLDLDTLRRQLGDWRADPASAGVRAREIGLAIARAQLAAGGSSPSSSGAPNWSSSSGNSRR